jgi:plasmid stabilization system protein ParE
MNLIFHPEASEEMLESARFYESKSDGLGSDFLIAVEDTTRRILERPNLGRIEKANIRRRLVPGFPFTILYESHQDRILIAAVMHQRRRPGYWRKRLSS